MLLLCILAFYDLKFYTNTNYVYQLRSADSLICAATSGGLSMFSTQDGSFNVFTSAEGLPSNWCSCLAVDRDKNIWVGTDNGVAILKSDHSSIMNLPHGFFPSPRIRNIFIHNDTAFIATEGGLLFIDTKGTLTDTTDDDKKIIRTSNGLVSDSVLSVANNKYLWAGTINGISRFNKSFDSVAYYLSGHQVQRIVSKDTVNVYVGTNKGLYVFRDTLFDTLVKGWDVNDLALRNDSLFIVIPSDLIIYKDSFMVRNESLPPGVRLRSVGLLPSQWAVGLGNNTAVFDNYGEGIAIRQDNRYRVYKRKCIPSNRVVDVTVAANGDLYVAHGPRGSIGDAMMGISVFKNDSTWLNFRRPTIPTDMVHRCDADRLGRVWFGGNWEGAVFFYDTKGDSWVAYNPGNSGMLYPFSWDVRTDEHNNMLVVTGDPARVIALDSSLTNWYSLNPADIGQAADMDVRNGKIYVATKEQGVVIIDTRSTLFDTEDDSITRYNQELPSTDVQGVRITQDGKAYLASEAGVLVIDGSAISSFSTKNSGLTNDDCLAITIDRQNRIWVLTKAGISIYAPHFGTWQKIGFSENSLTIRFAPERLDNKAFLFDSTRNCVWLGSKSGLLRINLAEPAVAHFDSAFVYPNPLTPADHALVFRNLPSDATLHVYTISGRKIHELHDFDVTVRGFVWFDPVQKLVSGMYFALATSPSKGKKVIKFAVVK